MAKTPRGKELYRNAASYFGGLLVFMSALLILATLVWSFSLAKPSPYVGIFTYMVFPAFLALGALVFLYGMRRESIRRRKLGSDEALPYPRLDLNDPRSRKRFAVALVGGGLLSVLMAFVGYNAFLFTESVTFCGRICHTVMEPEYTAYQHSPHARVTCVQCHVGHGAEWYVKSKLSGMYQVYSVIAGAYKRPIPTPIENLRPARETCEECHWPEKLYGAQLMQNPHFRYDEKNTPEQVTLLVKTGGGQRVGHSSGIHWHMVISNQITYAALDEKLQEIPWVSVKRADGTVREYLDTRSETPPQDLAKLQRHLLDCIDCHNRPTHIYPAPENAVDQALATRLIAAKLPWIKKVAVDALVREYPDRAAAHEGIRKEIEGFYRKNYPAVSGSADVAAAVEAVSRIYDRSVFPAMKVNWLSYGSNIGHRNWPGCFRCHDGKHVAADGTVLRTECTICHTMPERGPLAPLGTIVPAHSGGWHPWELGGRHAQAPCTRCHAAGYRPPTECAECHKLDARAPMMASGCDTCHAKPGEAVPVADCKGCHEKLRGLHLKGAHPDASCTDCHKPHGWAVKGRDACLACHDDRKEHNKEGACAECHEFRK